MNANDYQTIERSIEFIENHFSEQPSLKEIAAHAGLSEYHFQRLFKRWAGISPKRFVQYATAQYTGALLREDNSILEASMEGGLSSTSRLHDLFVNIYAMTPEEYRQQARSLTIHYGWSTSPFGHCLVGMTDRGVCWLSFHERPDASALDELKSQWRGAKLSEDSIRAKEVVKKVFGNKQDDTAPFMIHLKGTNLQIQVWEALLRIPPGKLVSYTNIAKTVDRSNAVRAIASAVGRNPVSYIVPCHRVIRRTGLLGGYRWGLARKKAILVWEVAQTN